MTKRKRIVNTLFILFAIVAIMALAVGCLFIAGIAVGAEVAFADGLSLDNGVYTFNNSGLVFSTSSYSFFEVSQDSLGTLSFTNSNNIVETYSFSMLRSSGSGYYGSLVFATLNGNLLLRESGYQWVLYWQGGSSFSPINFSFTLNTTVTRQNLSYWSSAWASKFTFSPLAPSVVTDTLSSGWHISSPADQAEIDISGGDPDNIYSFDFSSLDSFKFVYDNIPYVCPYGLYAYVSLAGRPGIVYVFADSLSDPSTGISLWVSPDLGEGYTGLAYIYEGIDYPSDINSWTQLDSTHKLYLYNSASLSSSAQTADEIIAFNVLAGLWHDYDVFSSLTYTTSVTSSLALFSYSYNLYTSNFANAISSVWYPATYTYDFVEVEWKSNESLYDWELNGVYSTNRDFVFLPTYNEDIDLDCYPLYQYRYRGRVLVGDEYHYSDWYTLDTSVYELNAPLVKKLYENGYSVGHGQGYVDGYTAGAIVGENAPNGLIDLAFGIAEIPIKVILGTWDSDNHEYVGGVLDWKIFGVNLRDFFLSIICLLFIIRIWGIFATGGIPNLIPRSTTTVTEHTQTDIKGRTSTEKTVTHESSNK